MDLAILPCGKKKIWDVSDVGPTRADEAYIGTLHKLTKEYASMFCNGYVILSAKHGFLAPKDIVPANYDLTFPTNQGISQKELAAQLSTYTYDRIVLLTGKKYISVVKPIVRHKTDIVRPLAPYKGIGYMLQALQHAIATNEPLHVRRNH
ncbi:DUF6884 domain-containing protein [Paenalkalicoccus suaedae]|nr:DUF6884 domain-containing protein [Paenalkalicoccus suaedae]